MLPSFVRKTVYGSRIMWLCGEGIDKHSTDTQSLVWSFPGHWRSRTDRIKESFPSLRVSAGGFGQCVSIYSGFDDLVADRVADDLAHGMAIDLAHDVGPVSFHCFHA